MQFKLINSGNSFNVNDMTRSLLFEAKRCGNTYNSVWNRCSIKECNGVFKKRVFIVDDTSQSIGAFKIRGAAVAIQEIIRKRHLKSPHICAASSGSFGMSVAFVARKIGLRSTIFMPDSTPDTKIHKIEGLGADVVTTKGGYEDAKIKAKRFADISGEQFFLDGVGWEIFTGNASLILELVGSRIMVKSGIAVIVPLGIGSLAVPTALILKQMGYDFDLYLVEPQSHCKFLYEYKRSALPEGNDTLAEGAAVNILPDISKNILRKLTKGVVALSEDEVATGIRYLWNEFRLQSEGAGALGIAAYLSNEKLFEKYRQVFAFVTGNNIDPQTFNQITREENICVEYSA